MILLLLPQFHAAFGTISSTLAWVDQSPVSSIGHGNPLQYVPFRGGVSSTQGLGPTMTARGQSIGISIGMLPQTLIMPRLDQLSHEFSFFIIHIFFFLLLGRHGDDYGTKDIQVLHYGISP
jgi:hypothetical protein